MRRSHKMLILGGPVLFVGIAALALGQDGASGATTEQRLLQLERSIATLDTQLQLRTNSAGAQDRTNRDFNLDARLDRIELSIEQAERRIMDLERQTSDALRTANQAQREAQMAQQSLRNIEARTR